MVRLENFFKDMHKSVVQTICEIIKSPYVAEYNKIKEKSYFDRPINEIKTDATYLGKIIPYLPVKKQKAAKEYQTDLYKRIINYNKK